MNADFTPGPWFLDPDDRDGMEWNIHICSDEARDNRICFMANYSNEHDAALIIAAPDLYEALNELEKCVELSLDGAGLSLQRYEAARVAAVAALRKARGETP